jgi:hypothetical protein
MSSATSKDIFNTAPDVAESLITDCIGHLHSVFGDIVLEPLKSTPEDSVILAKFWERKAKEVSFGQSRNVPFGQSRSSSSSVSSSDLSLRSSLFQPISPSGQSPTFQSVPPPVINTMNDYAPISIKSASGTTTGELEMKHISYDKGAVAAAVATAVATAAPSGGTPVVAPAGGAQVVAPAAAQVTKQAVAPVRQAAPAAAKPAAAPVLRPAVAPGVAPAVAPALPPPPVNTKNTVLTAVEPPPPPVAPLQVPNLQIESSVSSTPSSTSRSSTLLNPTASSRAKITDKVEPSKKTPFRGGDE